MQSIDEFSEQAKIAYQAYLDMGNSKTAHLESMKAMKSKYESGGQPSAEEKLALEKLLGDHDKNVMAFTTAFAAVTDSDEKSSLIELMS
tara:strand:- start:295 stop:561 length:267 start_codon:yes stop_codon:yes gene_type:complete